MIFLIDVKLLEKQADVLFQNIAGWEQSVLKRIGKRINAIGEMSAADAQALNNIADVKQDMKAIIKELSNVTGLNISQIEKIYGDVIAEQHLANKALYDYRVKKFMPFEENRELQAITRAYARSTGRTMMNLSKTKLLCIRNENGRFVKMQKGVNDILDKAVMQVASGAQDFHTAMRETIVQLGSGGLRVDYGGGITRRLDTVVRQNLLWGAKQASVAYNEIIGYELDCDGIEVDWHTNPRPSHEFMQGKQFVLGKARMINGEYFESADEALERLQDYGCLHFKTPIICGISEPRYSKEELERLNAENARTYEIDGKTVTGYEATQMQRRLETAVREQKGIKAVAQASGNKELVKQCNDRIKLYQSKYDEISNITGIAKEPNRMTVSGAKNVLTKSAQNDIVKNKNAIGLSRYVNSNDDLYKYSKNIVPLKDYEDQVIHGDQFGFEIRDLNGVTSDVYTPREFAEILKEDPNYYGGDIRLISCEAGKGDVCAAQMLANQLGVNVMAPTDMVWVFNDGEIIIGPTQYENTGKWKIFKPVLGGK